MPGFRTLPGSDEEDVTWREDWFAWRDRVIVVRATVQMAMQSRPELRAAELELCSRDPAYWLTMYGTIDEPRAIDGEDYFKDFIPFAFQVHLLQWFVRNCESATISDGYVSKARGLGATWIMCAGAVWAWLFRPWRGILVSRKEDLVDKPLDLNSMFGKIDLLLDFIPRWMEPSGYDRKRDRLRMMIKHPKTRAQITGESTTGKAGRGARATYIIYDEAAFIPDFQEVYATGAGTTNHRFGVSSESFSEGYYWFDTWNAVAKVSPAAVQQLDYFHNAYFSPEWYEAEFARWDGHDPEGFQREYLRDPWAGFGEAVYPIATQLHESALTFVSGIPLLVGIDPGMADDTAIVFAQFEGEGPGRHLRFVDSYERNRMPAEWYAHILTGILPEIGDACYGLNIEKRDKYIMDILKDVPPNLLQVCCDPSGGQRDASGQSFVERIVLESLRLRTRKFERDLAERKKSLERQGISPDAVEDALRHDLPRPKAIVPMYKDLYQKNRHDQRRLALRKILTSAVFAQTHGAARIRLALKHYRFNEPGDKATSQPAPIHDQWSHLVTACEFLAVWIGLNVFGGIESPLDMLAREAAVTKNTRRTLRTV